MGGYTFEHRLFELTFFNTSTKQEVRIKVDPFSLSIKESIDNFCSRITCMDDRDDLIKSAHQIYIETIYNNVWKDYNSFLSLRYVSKNSKLFKKKDKNNFNSMTSSWRDHLALGQEHLIKDYNTRDAEINALLIGHVFVNPVCLYTDNQGVIQPSAHFPHKRCHLARIFYNKNITNSSFAWSTNSNPSETDIDTLVGFTTELFNIGLWEHARALSYFVLFGYNRPLVEESVSDGSGKTNISSTKNIRVLIRNLALSISVMDGLHGKISVGTHFSALAMLNLESEEYYVRALVRLRTILQIPAIPREYNVAITMRKEMISHLHSFTKSVREDGISRSSYSKAFSLISATPFHMAHQGIDDRELQEHLYRAYKTLLPDMDRLGVLPSPSPPPPPLSPSPPPPSSSSSGPISSDTNEEDEHQKGGAEGRVEEESIRKRFDTRGRRLKVCFVSANLYYHSIGKMMVELLYFINRHHLSLEGDKNVDIELSALLVDKLLRPPTTDNTDNTTSTSSYKRTDSITNKLEEVLGDRYRRVHDDTTTVASTLAHGQYDWIVYLDIGMEFTTYITAAARLAPFQAVWWGHPVTSGLPNIDYFFGLEVEVKYAEQHYTEQHVRMHWMNSAPLRPLWDDDARYIHPIDKIVSNPTTNTTTTTTTTTATTTATTATTDDGSFATRKKVEDKYDYPYALIIGRMFKIHPSFQRAVVQILMKSPESKVVMIAEDFDPITQEIYESFQRTVYELVKMTTLPVEKVDEWCNNVMSRLLFVEYAAYADYIVNAKVILDTFPYGGCLTSHDALSNAIPMVTLPLEHVRGRYTLGMYKQMGHHELVAYNESHYTDIAIRLLDDAAYYRDQVLKIREAWKSLNRNKDVALEWLQFMRKVSDNHIYSEYE